MAESAQSLFDRLRGQQDGRALPPVERWSPGRHGSSGMRIDVNGRWFHEGEEILRPEMVRLFSTVLRRDDDGYQLVTPAERLSIEVEDVPFVAVDVEQRGRGRGQDLAFATHVGDIVIADADHPLTMRGDAENPRPYVRVRARLDARIARAVYYRLVDLGVERRSAGSRVLGVWSAGRFFELGTI